MRGILAISLGLLVAAVILLSLFGALSQPLASETHIKGGSDIVIGKVGPIARSACNLGSCTPGHRCIRGAGCTCPAGSPPMHPGCYMQAASGSPAAVHTAQRR